MTLRSLPGLLLVFGLVLGAFGLFSRPAAAKEKEKPEGVPAAQATVGHAAPDFTLTDTEGKEHRMSRYLAEGKTVVLEWFNPDCPFVRRHHEQDRTMARVLKEHSGEAIVWLAVNSAAPGKQGAGRERNAKARKDYSMDYPVLLDQSGQVGRAYAAKTTPHMFVIRKDGVLIYAGGIDNDPRGTNEERINYVSEALSSCAAGKEPPHTKTDSYGCSVKYGEGTSM